MPVPFAAIGGALSAIGSLAGGLSASSQASKDRKWQQRLAKNQVQFRVADAKAAGVHPLFALGMSPMSYSPTAVHPGDYGGSAIGQMGQDISRAISAGQTERERRLEQAAALQRTAALDAQNIRESESRIRENDANTDYFRSQIARMNSAQLGPGAPSGRLGDLQTGTPNPAQPMVQQGVGSDYQYVRGRDGRLHIIPSEAVANTFDEIPGAGVGWFLRNNLTPMLRGTDPPYPTIPPPHPGQHWAFDRATQSWVPRFPNEVRRPRTRRPSYSQRPGNF